MTVSSLVRVGGKWIKPEIPWRVVKDQAGWHMDAKPFVIEHASGKLLLAKKQPGRMWALPRRWKDRRAAQKIADALNAELRSEEQK